MKWLASNTAYMPVSNNTANQPHRQNVSEGTFAIGIIGDRHSIWQYDTESPFRSDPDWRKVDELEEGSAPPVDLSAAEFEVDGDGNAWVYASSLVPEHEVDTTQRTVQESLGKYVMEFSDGEIVSGNTQSDAIVAAVNHLIRDHDITNRIDVPFRAGYKNAFLHHKPEHPDGSKMERAKEVSKGYYVYAKAGKEQKKKYLRKLTSEVGLDIEYRGEW
jgi:hypothetical protein